MQKFLQRTCSSSAVRGALDAFTAAGMALPTQAKPVSVSQAYERILSRFCDEVVIEAADLIATGQAGEAVSKKFFPTAPEMVAVCERIEDRWKIRTAALSAMLGYPEARRVLELTEDQRRARAAQIAGLLSKAASEEAKP